VELQTHCERGDTQEDFKDHRRARLRTFNDLHPLRAYGRITMWTDPIVEEIHQIRLAHAEKHNFNLEAIFNDIKAHEIRDKRHVVTMPIKRKQRPPIICTPEELLGEKSNVA
jgi:hypothetical protein